MTGYIPRWFTRLQTVTHPSTIQAVHGRESSLPPVDHKSDVLTITLPNHFGATGSVAKQLDTIMVFTIKCPEISVPVGLQCNVM